MGLLTTLLVSSMVSAVADAAKSKHTTEKEVTEIEKQIVLEQETTKRLELKQQKANQKMLIKHEKQMAKQQMQNQQMLLRQQQSVAAQQAYNQRLLIEEQSRAQHFNELNSIRQARAANPIIIPCPRCNGTRDVNKISGIISCPYCDLIEYIHPAHKYHPELDGPLQPVQQYPPQYPQSYQRPNSTAQQLSDGIKGAFSKFFK